MDVLLTDNELLKVEYDMTVRNNKGKIIQFASFVEICLCCSLLMRNLLHLKRTLLHIFIISFIWWTKNTYHQEKCHRIHLR